MKMTDNTLRDTSYRSRLRFGALLVAATLAGCAARGPQTVPADAFDYSAAISKTRSDQMLLNIVRSRYTQVPNFLTVSSVIAGYTYQGNFGASAQSGFGRFDENFVAGAANMSYIERPTITYTPLQGEEFSRRMMRNIPVEVLFSLGQAGWPTDVLFRIAVERFGKTRNMGFSAPEVVAHADEQVKYLTRYDRVVNIIKDLGQEGVIEVIQTEFDDGVRNTVRFAESTSPELMDQATELKSLLGLNPDRNEFHVTDRVVSRTDNEILIQTRSMLAILGFLGLGVEVPKEDVDANRVLATPAYLQKVIEERGPMRIRVQKERPEDPFAAVQYRNQWFYIDGTDHLSKRTFGTIQLLFELLAPSGVGVTPLLSLPAG